MIAGIGAAVAAVALTNVPPMWHISEITWGGFSAGE